MLNSGNQTENLYQLLQSRYSDGDEWQRTNIPNDSPLSSTLLEMAEKGWILYANDDEVNPDGEKLGTYLIQLTDEGEIVARQIGLSPVITTNRRRNQVVFVRRFDQRAC